MSLDCAALLLSLCVCGGGGGYSHKNRLCAVLGPYYLTSL